MYTHEQHQSMRLYPTGQRMTSGEGMLHGRSSMHGFHHPERMMQSLQQRTSAGPVEASPFHQADQTLPARYDPYGHLPSELSPNMHHMTNRTRKMNSLDPGFVMGTSNGNRMYRPQMGGIGQQTSFSPPEYVMPPDQWGFLGNNGGEGRIQGTAQPPIGVEHHALPGQPAFPYSANPVRPQQQPSLYSHGSGFLSGHPVTGQQRQERIMRPAQQVDDFLSGANPHETPTRVMHPMRQHEARLSQPYPKTPTNWPHQTPRHGTMVTPGVPPQYDPGYTDNVALHPLQQMEYTSYNMRRPIMPIPSNTRQPRVPQTQQEAQEMERLRRTQQYGNEAPRQAARASDMNRGQPMSGRDQALSLYKQALGQHYHRLMEASSICEKAQKMHADQASARCLHEIRTIVKAARSLKGGRPKLSTVEFQSFVTKFHERAAAVIADARRIKARMESPQSINTIINHPMEDQEDGQHAAAPMSRVPAQQTHPVHMQRYTETTPSNTQGQKFSVGTMAAAGGFDYHKERTDETEKRTGLQRLRVGDAANRFQLQPKLGNDYQPSPSPGLTQLSSPHEPSQKRAWVVNNDVNRTITSPRQRNIRPRLNPSEKDIMIQAGVQQAQTPMIRVADPAAPPQGFPHPMTEHEGSNDDRTSFGKKVLDDDVSTPARIKEVLEQLEAMDDDNSTLSEDVFGGLRERDDEWIYNRQLLETVASKASSQMTKSRVCTSVTRMTFKHDEEFLPASDSSDSRSVSSA